MADAQIQIFTIPSEIRPWYLFGLLCLPVGLILVGLALASPWYSEEDRRRIDELRKTIPGLQDKSYSLFLLENPAWAKNPLFRGAPARHLLLDWGTPALAIVTLMVGIVLTLVHSLISTPITGTARPGPLTMPRAAAIPIAELVEETGFPEMTFELAPPSRTLVCAYCGGSFTTDLGPGQPINCPHCGAAFKMPAG